MPLSHRLPEVIYLHPPVKKPCELHAGRALGPVPGASIFRTGGGLDSNHLAGTIENNFSVQLGFMNLVVTLRAEQLQVVPVQGDVRIVNVPRRQMLLVVYDILFCWLPAYLADIKPRCRVCF